MKTPIRILHLEDSVDDAIIIEAELRHGGFEPEIVRVDQKEPFQNALATKKLDIILSDYNLPYGWNGLDALDLWIEAKSETPYIFISGTLGEDKAVDAMKKGANDYLVKSNLKRLVPAIQREMREAAVRRERKYAQDALRETEERFQAFMDNTPAAVFIKDTDGRYLFVNKMWQDVFGKLNNEIQGKTDLDIWPPKIAEAVQKHDKEVIVNKKSIEIIELIPAANGNLKEFITIKFPLKIGEKDRFIGGVAIDITERREAEKALREKTEELSRFFNLDLDLFCIADTEGYFRKVNRAWEKTLGYPPEELEGKKFLDFVHPEDINLTLAAMSNLSEGEQIYNFVNRYRCRDGSYRWIEWRASPHENKLIYAAARDITERREAMERIQEQAALLNISRDAILVRDLEHRILFWNKGAELIYGYDSDEAIGKPITDLIYDDITQFNEAFRQVMKDGIWIGELKHVSKEQKEVTVLGRWTLMYDDKGKPKSILAVNTDITKQKKLESQFLRAQRMESIGTLAGGIAHDLNNVLGPILLATQILRGKLAHEHDKKFVDMLEVSAKRGADIVRQVLTFARGVEGEKVSVQLKHLIKEMVNIAQETFPKTIQITQDVRKELWNISGDATQLHQVLLNLCVNARDAMPNGGSIALKADNIMIDQQYAQQFCDAKPGPYVVLSVTDTGTGIPKELIEKIFEPFFTTKEVGKGTGLGLSTVLGIIKTHHGFITVESKPGKGTTFFVYLPAVKSEIGEGTAKKPKPILPGNGELILVIDDEAGLRDITKATLETYDYKIMTAQDGTDGLTTFVKHKDKIKAVIVDMIMPFMDGPSTIRAIHRLDPDMKIVAISGSVGSIEAYENDAAVKAFLRKPFTAETLVKTLHEILNPE